MRIVSKGEIVKGAEQALAEIQKELEQAAKTQQKALDTVRAISKEKKIDQQVRDKLTDGADVPQRDVRDTIGKIADDGILGKLQKIRQTLKANNLEDTRPYKEAGGLKGGLNNIAQDELQQIEPKLKEIYNDLNHADKNDAKTKAKLDDTARLQENVVKTLNELIAKMDPGAKMRDIRIGLREITGDQQKLHDEMAKMKADKAQEEKDFPNPNQKAESEKRFTECLQQKAEEQKALAERLEKLIKEMKDEAKQQEKLGKKDEAKKINDAVKELEQQQPKEKPKQEPKVNQEERKLPLNTQMKKVAEQLKNKSEAPQQALDQQDKISDALENALKQMEGRNPNVAQEEIKERKEIAREIQKLNNDLKELRKQDREAEKIKDMQERLKAKQEIAKKFADLQQDIEKARRHAARLQEQQIANELKEAADQIGKAGNKVGEGENADAEAQKAKDHLQQAKREAQEAEEELARELLIKMADQLKGLKERQDASLKRTEVLHPKVIRIKSWTEAFLTTLEGNVEVQKGIAEETDTLKEKLKEAVVFGGILERAKKSMDDAVKVMDARKTEGFNRRFIEKGEGELMDEDALKDENEAQYDTVRHQKQAARSLTNLLDALKEEIDKPKKQKPPQDPKEPEKQEDPKEQPKGGLPMQDGIPPKAQLKALKAEQMDLNERTIDFDKRNPDPAKFTDRQRRELRELEAEQTRLENLFERLTAPPAKEGEQP